MWRRKTSCQKRSLLSLIGRLSHACKVVVAGRIYLRRMMDSAKKAPLGSLDAGIPLRPGMVGYNPQLLEWEGDDEHSCPRQGLRGNHLYRHFRVMGLWGTHWLQCQWEETWVGESIAAKSCSL